MIFLLLSIDNLEDNSKIESIRYSRVLARTCTTHISLYIFQSLPSSNHTHYPSSTRFDELKVVVHHSVGLQSRIIPLRTCMLL